ncbi:trypsin-like peptidase domain-containing protein [Streptomyces polygonati]|uniref:Trypsin-like peptidase domain-containing protein n=1 Tax=Streptomyces polygonati TaxID=1617087 RepID=A0ABV8HPX5_9ACTN
MLPTQEPYAAPRPVLSSPAPTQAPPPVGPPSPYGAPPSALASSGYEPGRPAPAPSPYEPPRPAPYPAPAQPPVPPPYEAPRPAYGAEAMSQGQEQPGQPAGSGEPVRDETPTADPFAVPATPSYAVPPAQHGGGTFGGGSGPGFGSGSGSGGGGWGAQFPAAPVEPGSGSKRRGAGLLIVAVVVAALVAGGVGGAIGYNAAKNNDNSGSTTVSAPKDAAALNRAPTSVAGIASKALPSVVTIKASGSQESGTGTGFVFDTQGHILTNNHVVAPAANGGKLTVTFSNGKTYDADVVGRAQGYDVAVVKLKNPGGVKLTPLPLGNSDDAAVGDATIAIGAPFGLSGTVTTGIVSAVHRPVASSDGEGSAASYMSAIQTDASINPGNSGGPLLNANGAVIGIDSAIQPGGTSEPGTQGGSVGLGFAIPINQAKRVAGQLIKTGQPVYPVIGVSLDTTFTGTGAKISTDTSTAITAGGPGAQAGLKPGDVITKFDDTLIDSGQTLIGEIWQHQPGDKVTLTYTRGGSTQTTTVTLGSRTGDSTN